MDTIQKIQRKGASVNAYLILKEDNQVLLHLRKNTGYLDGFWGLVSGHVEEGEAASEAMIREAEEEAGITPIHLTPKYVIHRRSDRNNIDVFFECDQWEGVITNREPDKCENLAFFPENHLPVNTIDFITRALTCISEGHFYSEEGWNE